MYKINDIINVTITSILSYGVFVIADNDYTGLIHISEINGKYIYNIKNYFKENKVIRAKIIGINEEKKQLSLSLKDIAKSNEKVNQNKLKESGSGFKELHDNLPKWIDETKKEIENSK